MASSSLIQKLWREGKVSNKRHFFLSSNESRIFGIILLLLLSNWLSVTFFSALQCLSPCLALSATAEMTWTWWESPSTGNCTCRPGRCILLCMMPRRVSTPGSRLSSCASWETTLTHSSSRWVVVQQLSYAQTDWVEGAFRVGRNML